jgi:hypothetical protein
MTVTELLQICNTNPNVDLYYFYDSDKRFQYSKVCNINLNVENIEFYECFDDQEYSLNSSFITKHLQESDKEIHMSLVLDEELIVCKIIGYKIKETQFYNETLKEIILNLEQI